MWHGSRNFHRWYTKVYWGLKAIMEIAVVFANNAYTFFYIIFFLSLENFIHAYDMFCSNLPPFPPLWFPSYPPPKFMCSAFKPTESTYSCLYVHTCWTTWAWVALSGVAFLRTTCSTQSAISCDQGFKQGWHWLSTSSPSMLRFLAGLILCQSCPSCCKFFLNLSCPRKCLYMFNIDVTCQNTL